MALDPDDDLVMESTTDTPEQIAEGLGIELEAAPDDDAAAEIVDPVDDEPALETAADDDVADTDLVKPEVTPAPQRAGAKKPVAAAAAKKPDEEAPKPRQSKRADAAAASARRKAQADQTVLELENEALRARLKKLAGGGDGDPEPTSTVPAVAARVVKPEEVPETHPELVAVDQQITALGAKPKQEDFDDFAEFETKRDQWIEDKAALRAERNSVRKDVARQETARLADANRVAATAATAFQKTVVAARARHADHDALVAAQGDKVSVSEDMAKAIETSPVGGELRYYFCKYPAEATRINALSAHRQVAEIGKIEDRIEKALKTDKGGKAGTTTPSPAARTTRAPEPQRTFMGDLPGGGVEDVDLNDPELSQAEYNRARDRMDEQSGRRAYRSH